MYNRLPFEIHDKIVSALCQTGTYKDIVNYGLTSKYHYALLEQNLDFKALKNTIRFAPLPLKRTNKDNIVWSIIPWSLHYIDGVYIENSCGGRIINAKFWGNDCLIEQLDNPELGNGWIPFQFSKHHHNTCEFPALPMTYVRFSVQITFDKPQLDTLKMGVHGTQILKFGTRELNMLFQPFDFFYPDTSQRLKVAGGTFWIDAVDQLKSVS